MVRTDPDNRGDLKDLKDFLLQEFKIPFVQPTLSYRNAAISLSEKIVYQTQMKRQTIVLSEGVFQGHNGYLFSCETCRDKDGMMKGAGGKRDFLKKHNKEECILFQKEFAEQKAAWGYDSVLDKHNILHGHPNIEGNPQRISKKFLASQNPTSDSQKKPTKKRKMTLKLPEDVVPDLVEDEEQSDEEEEESVLNQTSKKEKKDTVVSDIRKTRTGKVRKQMTKTSLNYKIPQGWEKTKMPEAKAQRHEKMLTARAEAYEESGDELGHWRMEEEDIPILEEQFLKHIYSTSAKYQLGQFSCTPETRDNLKKGKKAAKGEEHMMTKTAEIYTDVLPTLMRILQKHLDRKLRLFDFFAFGQEEMISPFNIYDLVEEDASTVGVKQHIMYTYLHWVEAQRRVAEKNPQKFRYLVNEKDKNEAQIQNKAMKESVIFRNHCSTTIDSLKTEAKKINTARTAQTLHNKKVAREVRGEKVPNPVEYLPKYWADSEVQQLEKDLLQAALQDEAVTPGELLKLTNHVITSTLLKNAVRNQILTTLKHGEFLRALEPDRLVYYPFRPKEGENDKDGDDTPSEGLPTGYIFDRNRVSDAPEGETDYLTGAIIEQDIHKTTLQGPAKLFLDRLDITRWELYRAVCKKYGQSIGQEYNSESPMFINGEMTAFGSKRTLNWSIWKRVCGISAFHGHLTRNMLATFAGSRKSLMVRELAAMAASHSVATQERTYRTHALQQLQVVTISEYYRRECQIAEEQLEANPCLPFISEDYDKELEEDLLEMTRSNQERLMEQEAAMEKEVAVRDGRSMTQDVKFHVFRMIIGAGDNFWGRSKYNWQIHFPEDLMTGNDPRNVKHKSNFLMLFDYLTSSEEMPEQTAALMDNLIAVTKIEAKKDKILSDEEFINHVENLWTLRIMDMLHSFKYSEKVNEIRSFRLKNMLAEFNLDNDYKYCFGNPELKRILTLHNEEQQAKGEAMKRITQRDKNFTPKKALQSYAELAQKRADEETDRRLVEEDRRAKERDEFFEDIPETTSALKRVTNTPNKNSIEIEAGDSTVTVSITPNKTGKRQLEDPRDNTPAKMRRKKSFEIKNKSKKGQVIWTDVMLVQLLGEWILFSEYPFAKDHGYNGGKVASQRAEYRKETIEKMLKKCKIILKTKDGRSYKRLLGDFTTFGTIWEKLNKKGNGLKRDKGSDKKLLDYLDDLMDKKNGPHTEVLPWTDKMAREGREELLEYLYSKIKERPGDPESGGEADLESSDSED